MPDPVIALYIDAASCEQAALELEAAAQSPAEKKFARVVLYAAEAVPMSGGEPLRIWPQHPIPNTPYRVDWLVSDMAHKKHVAIEVDGFTYHSSEAAFSHDRQRDRALAEQGIRVLRFTAREAMAKNWPATMHLTDLLLAVFGPKRRRRIAL